MDGLSELLDGPTDRRSRPRCVTRRAGKIADGQRETQTNGYNGAALVQQLPREQRRAQSWVQISRRVEQSRVRAIDECRQHVCACGHDQASNRRSPRRVDTRAGWSMAVGDLAGREDHKRSAIPQPEMCRAQAGPAASAGRRSAERIHKETQLRQVWDA
jgi:hypothetical protein